MASYDKASFYPDISVGYLAKRVYQASLTGLENAFEGEDISFLQWTALVSILYGRAATCKDLARDLAHDRGATTRLIDTLETRQLVERRRATADRRVVNLTLTDAGSTLAKHCTARVVDLWNGWLAEWKPADVAQLINYLQLLRGTLEAAPKEIRIST